MRCAYGSLGYNHNEPSAPALALGSTGSIVNLSHAIIDPYILVIHANHAQALLRSNFHHGRPVLGEPVRRRQSPRRAGQGRFHR
ncbi:hypothetical protein BCEN4_700028 [Burkholderia cenocepacia]|nr:hypothetical protein BCEN4_700028 [Burkholderia cenocepacia]